jgi:hypothetical protein
MSKLKTLSEQILVHIVRPGVGAVDYHLSAGATLADLFRISETAKANQAVFVDGATPEEAVPLHEGTVVTIVPRPMNGSGDEPWRATLSAFGDEALYQEYSEVPNARRNDVDPDQESQDR